MISLCMIVKNEIKFIEECLNKVKAYVDEIIIVDTGSTDGTLEVLEKFECSVFAFDWCEDYAKVRNFSIAKATNEWVLILDADEQIEKFDKEEINRFINKSNGYDIGEIKLKSYVGDYNTTKISRIPRLFNKKYFEYERVIHERLKPKSKDIKPKIADIPIEVIHFGYLESVSIDKDKNNKYINILKKELSKEYDPYLQKHLISCYYNGKLYKEALEEIEKFLKDKKAKRYEYFSEVICTNIKCLNVLQRYNEAENLEEYFDICKDNDEYLYNLALSYSFVNRNEEAVDIHVYLVEKEELSIDRDLSIRCIGYILFMSGLVEDALTWFNMLKESKEKNELVTECKKILNK